MFRLLPALAVGTVLLAGCGEDSRIPRQTPPPKATPVRAVAPAGPPVQAQALPGDRLQEAATVMQLHAMPRQGAKLFAVGGGDPAANGLMTYLGLYLSSAEGWRLYEVGNFESWRVIEEGPGRVVLEVRESRVGTDGGIASGRRRLIVAFARGPDGAAPDSVTVTPAR